MQELERQPPDWETALQQPGNGKMLGVLVVQRPDGKLGVLRGFSGMLNGAWSLPGFVPPLFDLAARLAIETPGEAHVKALWQRSQALRDDPERLALLVVQTDVGERHTAQRDELRRQHEARREERRRLRSETQLDAAALHALDQQSRADKAERLRLIEVQEAEVLRIAGPLRQIERRIQAVDLLRQRACRRLMRALHDLSIVPDATGCTAPIRTLFAKGEPPSGAGECAAPRLLAYAHRRGYRPIALAEFWWGAPPAGGGRRAGSFYPPCQDKCGPLLPWLLRGMAVDAPTRFRPTTSGAEAMRVVYEDASLVIVDKASGLLSVPGRDEPEGDSVLARLRRRYPAADGPLLVHRLDMDTSGLLVAALTSDAHAAVQRQFEARTLRKRYIAWVEGAVDGERGTITLPMRLDPHDRPRQVVDHEQGLMAVTEWEVAAREAHRTRLILRPHTGRTHQLRVHASHPGGLNAPIVGDRLYGTAGDRLMLHAEWIELEHPGTGERVAFEVKAPF